MRDGRMRLPDERDWGESRTPLLVALCLALGLGGAVLVVVLSGGIASLGV